MKRMMPIVCALFFLISCGPPKIDATDKETFSESIQKVLDKLPDERKAEFKDAVRQILFSGKDIATSIRDEELFHPSREAMTNLGGKTGEQIIQEAIQVQITRLRADIDALAKKKSQDDSIQADMHAVHVTLISIEQNAEQGCVMKIKANNGLQQTVGSLYVDVALPGAESASKDSSTRDELWFFFGDGLPPGKEGTAIASLSNTSACPDFQTAHEKNELVLKVTRIADPDRGTILERVFTKADEARQKELETALFRLMPTE